MGNELDMAKTGSIRMRHILGRIFRTIFIILFALVLGCLLICILFCEASVTSPYAGAQADTRIMATGLEAYWIDHDTYPTEAWRMTTPIAYLSRLPLDGCSEEGTEPFCYYTDGEGYIIVSRGPDRVLQIDPVRDFEYSENSGAIAPGLLEKCFDPTNGSVSAGDIFRIGPTERTLEERAAQEKENQADDE